MPSSGETGGAEARRAAEPLEARIGALPGLPIGDAAAGLVRGLGQRRRRRGRGGGC